MQFPPCVRRWEHWTELGVTRIHADADFSLERLGQTLTAAYRKLKAMI